MPKRYQERHAEPRVRIVADEEAKKHLSKELDGLHKKKRRNGVRAMRSNPC